MSYRRIFSLRELALCLVILANAIGLGAVILTTAVSASSTVESAEAVSTKNAPTLAVERVDRRSFLEDAHRTAVNTLIHTWSPIEELGVAF